MGIDTADKIRFQSQTPVAHYNWNFGDASRDDTGRIVAEYSFPEFASKDAIFAPNKDNAEWLLEYVTNTVIAWKRSGWDLDENGLGNQLFSAPLDTIIQGRITDLERNG